MLNHSEHRINYFASIGKGVHCLFKAGDCSALLERMANVMQLQRVEESSAREMAFSQHVSCELFSSGEAGAAPHNPEWPPESPAYIRGRINGRTFAFFPAARDPILTMRQMVLLLTKAILYQGKALLMHAALLEYRQQGIIITAAAGTGKTTCTRRIPHPWRAWCDDWVLLHRSANGWLAHPLPTWSVLWSDSAGSWPLEKALPLCAIYQLRQDRRDGIRRLGEIDAFSKLYCGCHSQTLQMNQLTDFQNENIFLKELDCLETLVQELPCFELSAALDGCFWNYCQNNFFKKF